MKNKISVSNQNSLDVVADGAIANQFTADGRIIPVIILNTEKDRRLCDLASIHKDSAFGDVESRWALKRFSKKFVYLVLRFEKPVELEVVVKFDVYTQMSLIDGIIQSRAVYVQPGKNGDRVGNTIDVPKILVEIPTRTTFDDWESIMTKTIEKRLKR
ncbi:hypothetical protein DZ860_03210 [Vibrio sinensis]|uniref:Uncharacterized protein n=1 Tax=Vibrio sinensis TaxID=2302434 RepID=A0A3A6R424_9VIBR|nr:hypothetical protein [Vibrio sinensis]RJX75699.1 hypothetical protein DZ860_03210 [Vibrio sinensis]